MKNITFSNCLEIPILGLGVFKSPDGSTTENAVTWALENDYRHIDTAMIYKNEHSVGNAIKNSSVKREDIFLTTKLWNDDIRSGNFRGGFEKSLEELQTDYLDLYLIHWPAEGFAKAWKELETLYKEKKVRSIGVSNFQIHHLEELAKVSEIQPMVNQIECHPLLNNQELIEYCQSRNIAIQAWSPLGGEGAPLLSNPTIVALAEKHGKTPAQIIFRWNIQRDVIVLTKSVNEDRIKSNIQVFDFELSSEDMALINKLNQNKRFGADPDNFSF